MFSLSKGNIPNLFHIRKFQVIINIVKDQKPFTLWHHIAAELNPVTHCYENPKSQNAFALIVHVNEVTYNQQALPEDVAGINGSVSFMCLFLQV